MADPPPTAAARVFSIAELLEQILLYVAKDASKRRSYELEPTSTLSHLRLIDQTCNNAVLHAIKRHDLYPPTWTSVKCLLQDTLNLRLSGFFVADPGVMNRVSIGTLDLRPGSQSIQDIQDLATTKTASWRSIPLFPRGSHVSKLKVQFSNVHYGPHKQSKTYYDEAIFGVEDQLGRLADVLVEISRRSEEEHEKARERMFVNKRKKQEMHVRKKNGL